MQRILRPAFLQACGAVSHFWLRAFRQFCLKVVHLYFFHFWKKPFVMDDETRGRFSSALTITHWRRAIYPIFGKNLKCGIYSKMSKTCFPFLESACYCLLKNEQPISLPIFGKRTAPPVPVLVFPKWKTNLVYKPCLQTCSKMSRLQDLCSKKSESAFQKWKTVHSSFMTTRRRIAVELLPYCMEQMG